MAAYIPCLIDVPDTPYTLHVTDLAEDEAPVYLVADHDLGLVTAVAIPRPEAGEHLGDLPWESVEDDTFDALRGDLRWLATYYGGYRIERDLPA